MPNRLADAASPYLLQHQDNPVDWYEWGDEAFAAARLTDRPVLLSVGYSACHWCHVMAHESFEDEATAAVMNANFINVKVDREERPDVDRIYMDAVTATSGQGGWPMTVFLTPDGRPFFAGTYFPKEPMHGRPSFVDVLLSVREAWRDRRGDLVEQADRLTAAIDTALPVASDLPDWNEVAGAVDTLSQSFDAVNGGFGGEPKFPQAPTLDLLMRLAAFGADRRALSMLTTTLDAMARGGIYDQLGGGFARYSVDAHWLVPHFEKMLYDNALLARVYLRTWQLTGIERFLHIARHTLDYMERDLSDPAGGLHAAEDADSEGEEGTFYVWSWAELGDVLGEDREAAAEIYRASPAGNFEGANILFLPSWDFDVVAKQDLDERLLERRSTRVRPGIDDKVVTAWNGLALRAYAEAGAVLGDDQYLEIAQRIGRFLVDQYEEHGGLLRSWRHGRSGPAGFSDDYAATAVGLFTLFEATGDPAWYDAAEQITRDLMARFADPDGGFFATAFDAEQLITRPKNMQDNPTPSDNALAAEALMLLAAYTGDADLQLMFENTVRAAGTVMARHPAFAGQMLAVWATALYGVKEVAVIDAPRLEKVVWEAFRPEVVLATAGTAPLLDDRLPGRAYVCRNMVCELPVTTPDALRAQLAGSGASAPRP